MNDEPMSPAAATVIEMLREEPGCAFGIGELLDGLGDYTPDTANELLDLIEELITDPLIHLVPGNAPICFAWVGGQRSVSSTTEC